MIEQWSNYALKLANVALESEKISTSTCCFIQVFIFFWGG